MSFCVVQIKDINDSKPVVTIVPATWVHKDVVFWPRKRRIGVTAKAIPDNTWRKRKCKILGKAYDYPTAREVRKVLQRRIDLEYDASDPLATTGSVNNEYEIVSTIEPPEQTSVPAQDMEAEESNDAIPDCEDTNIKEEFTIDSEPVTQEAIHLYDAETTDEPEQFDIQGELRKINGRLDRIETAMETIVSFMVDMDAFMKSKYDPQQPPMAEMNALHPEDFSEFKKIGLIRTNDELQDLDRKLQDASYTSKFVRYFKSIFNLNGKRDGNAFFRIIIRRLVAPDILIPYSWKGLKLKRNNMGESCSSFQSSFPNFINLMECILKCADISYTKEDTEKAFSNYLRQKNTELKRFAEGKLHLRNSSSRKRKKRVQVSEDKKLIDFNI